jgi:carbohydrate kinase (thermoresistant glucokinase family)|tara:strand:+ start:3659 stop:4171 length:513 start_codon:yes stop_codon:yes gene_type:complete
MATGVKVVIVVCGVSGSGKSTIGRALAERLNWQFEDADDYHPEVNRQKMQLGMALNDADREPWLADLAHKINRWTTMGVGVVLACSALKQQYRERLGIDQVNVLGVLLHGEAAVIENRLQARHHEFMPAGLLSSQLSTLELPFNGPTIDIDQTPQDILDEIARTVALIID